jgi:hypothetical protein
MGQQSPLAQAARARQAASSPPQQLQPALPVETPAQQTQRQERAVQAAVAENPILAAALASPPPAAPQVNPILEQYLRQRG